jgi:anti-anti-sigma regulatory factor
MIRSEALDIVIEGRGDATWLVLSGPFHAEQVPNIRGKFLSLLEDGNRRFIVDLEGITAIDEAVVQMFLTLLNDVRGKGGDLSFVFKNPAVADAFAPYQQLLPVFPDAAAISSGGLLRRFVRRSRTLSKKTGVRLSRRVAFWLMFVLCGWFLSLLFIIRLQNQRLAEQQRELSDLTQWKQRSTIELNALRERIRPLEQLGILRDTTRGPPR